MKNSFLPASFTGVLLLLSFSNFAQTPNLGAASTFSVFTAVGAFDNLGNTSIVGDIGTDDGAFTGFPPGVVTGQIHVENATSAMAKTDVLAAYTFLDNLTCGAVLSTSLGGGQILAPNIYCLGGASTLTGTLELNGGGNQNAVFILQINGAFSTGINSQVILTNGASICNVFWQVNGMFSLGDGSVFRGTLIAEGAISLLEGSSVFGRALSTAGAIDLHNNVVTIGLSPICNITVGGVFCAGQSTQLCATPGMASYLWNTGLATPCISVNAAGTYTVTVTNANGCTSVCSQIVSVNPPPTCNITGIPTFCPGGSTSLCATPGQSAYLWSNGSVSPCISVNLPGTYAVTITAANGCTSSCSQEVSLNPPPTCTITGIPSICGGLSSQLCATPGQSAYLWSNGLISECIPVNVAGIYAVTITAANGCTSNCSQMVSGNPPPTPDGPCLQSFCFGDIPTVADLAPNGPGFLWYATPTGGMPLPLNTVLVNGGHYYASQTVGGCESATRFHVMVSVVTPAPGHICLGGCSN